MTEPVEPISDGALAYWRDHADTPSSFAVAMSRPALCRILARLDAAEAERDDLRIIIEGCGCPAPYDQCPHDEPLTSEIKRLRAERDELRKALTYFGHDDRSLELFRRLRRASEDAPL